MKYPLRFAFNIKGLGGYQSVLTKAKLMSLIIFVLVLGGYHRINAQSDIIHKHNIEKEQILNVVINSVQFDSVYFSKIVYFKENELLSKNTPLNLKKGKYRIRIFKEERPSIKQFVVIGDFTMERENPTSVRVQLEILPQKMLLNVRLKKIEGAWKIMGHCIIEL